MQPKILPKRALRIIILSGLILFVALLSYFSHKNSIQDERALLIENAANLSALLNQEQASVGLPVYLKIPSLNVDTSVEYVSLTSDGAMDVPKGPQGVAWYMLGQKPGEIGSAVIAGHSGWKNNAPAVFDDLHKLRVGDKIFAEDGEGEITTFVVREIRKYNSNADATDVFTSNDGKAHLNLITCTGIWNKILKSRSDRLVVFTDKEEEL